jgi:putative transcriptional regulator
MGKTIYNRLKIVLTEHQITSRALAKHLGKTETTVSRWCTNDMQPPLEILYDIARYLDIEIYELLVPTKTKKLS